MVDEGLGVDEGPDQGVVQDGCGEVLGRLADGGTERVDSFCKVYTIGLLRVDPFWFQNTKWYLCQHARLVLAANGIDLISLSYLLGI